MGDIFWPGVAAIAVMYLLVFGVGVWASRGRGGGDQSLEELMLAGRALPLWLGLLTMTATWVGGGYINGTAEYTYSYGLIWGLQAPIGYALSLVLGGVFFARIMRRNGYATLVDPLEVRYGAVPAGIMMIAAVLSEVIWSAAILVALGTTFGTIIGLPVGASILLSAAVAIAYTVVGGMWSVAFTDAVQLALIVIGLLVALPFVIDAAGGIGPVLAAAPAVDHVSPAAGAALGFADGFEAASYADWTLLLMLGGIPWNIYFQRVLASPTEDVAAKLSVGGGLLCALMAIPPLFLGLSARAMDWGAVAAAAEASGVPGAEALVATLNENVSMVLPLLLRVGVPGWVGLVGLGAVAAAVMASVDSSILSASSLFAWNGYRRLFRPHASVREMVWLMRSLIVVFGSLAALLAVKVKSVAALWYLCGDVVYCLLFPQLALALFDRRANATGALAGLAVAAVLRLGGGEATLGLDPFLPYPTWEGMAMVTFPFRTLAMVSGLAVAVVVSRLTGSFDPPRPLGPAKPLEL